MIQTIEMRPHKKVEKSLIVHCIDSDTIPILGAVFAQMKKRLNKLKDFNKNC
jgi:hypothetical protein